MYESDNVLKEDYLVKIVRKHTNNLNLIHTMTWNIKLNNSHLS